MRIFSIFLLFSMFFNIHVFAQDMDIEKPLKKKIIKDYKKYYKSSDYAKAYSVLKNAFENTPNAYNDTDLLLLAFDAKYQQYLDENRKIFLNNNGDTVKFFDYVIEAYNIGVRCDSCVDLSHLSSRRKQSIKTDVDNKQSVLIQNLPSGGKYFLKNRNYQRAFQFFSLYLPSLDKYQKNNTVSLNYDDDVVNISKLTVHAAYGCQKYNEVLKYLPLAVSDTIRKPVLLEIGAKSAIQIQDSVLYHNILQSGFNEYPEIDYFKASLIQYYHNIKDYGNALTVIEQCLENDSLNVKYLKLKGNELLSMNKPQIAKTVYLSIIDLDPYDYDTASILGNIFLEEAHVFYASKNLSIDSPDYLKNRNYLIDLYSQAQQYYEIALKLRPQQPELWKNGLMEIYLRLNKGEDLRKIESL